MRQKLYATRYFDFSGESSVKVVENFRNKYQALSNILDANPDILDLAHSDWCDLLSTSDDGRGSRYTSEQLLRALIVMFVENEDYRGVVIRIDTSEFLHYFVRLGVQPTMDFTFLNRAFGTLSAETLEAMNNLLSRYALQQEKISGEKQRMDTTAYEVNIHYPTDSSLLWDSFRTLARLVGNVRKELPELELDHRFHLKKAKKLFTYISRNASSKSKKTQRRIKQDYRKLIESVRRVHHAGSDVLQRAFQQGYDVPSLSHYLPLVARIVSQADRRVLRGESVPHDEKLYSLFEEHTELIKRGKAGKPVEFGHKVLFCQTGEKFIHHYQVQKRAIADKDVLAPAVEAHKKLFGAYPDVLATDKGFYESMKQITDLEKNIKTVSIAKKGRRTEQEYARETTEEFKEGQRFRAGSEGSISVLKRAFKLGRCLFKGFRHYAASVGLAVLCHNLVLLTRL